MDRTSIQRQHYAFLVRELQSEFLYPEEIKIIQQKMDQIRHNWYNGSGLRCRTCNLILPFTPPGVVPSCQHCSSERGVAELSGRLSQVRIS